MNEHILKIGLAINNIAMLVTDSDLEKIKPILDTIQDEVMELASTCGMTLNEYQELASRTISKEMTYQDCEMHALHGMVGEIGELHSIYQKIYQGHMADHEHQKKELGDLMWFVSEYCSSKGWSMEDVAETNIEKLKARYPLGFSPDKSLHRAEGDI